MPLPWKKSKSGRISRFVSDFQQSPKHGGSLVVETGFPTSLIDLFVKNRDRLKKQSSKRNNNNNKTPPIHSIPTRRRVSSPPSSPPPLMQRHKSLPVKLDDPSSVKDVPAPTSKIEESFVINDGGLTSENKFDDGGNGGGGGGGGGCVLMVVALKVFVVAFLALSTKRLAVGITLSAFSLIFLERVAARVFTLLNLCPNARVRFGSLIGKIVGRKKQREEEKKQEESPPEIKNRVTFEIVEESTLEKAKPVEVEEEEREMETIRDVVFKKEKSKSSKLKSKIVKKIVPKKLRSYKKKKKMKNRDEEEDVEIIEIIGGGDEEEEEESVFTEVSSLFSDDRIGSEISERDEVSSNPPLLESCEEIKEEEEEEGKGGSKEDLTKAMVLIVIVLAGLLNGKVVAIGLTLSSCLILRLVCNKSQTSL